MRTGSGQVSTDGVLGLKQRAYLSCGGVQHTDVFPGHDVDQFARLNVPDFYKVRLERQYVWVRQRERVRIAFPGDLPVRTRTPAVAVDEERKVAVVEEELAVHTLDVNRFHILFACNEVERRVGLIQQGLRLRGLQADHFKASGTANTESRTEEVD